MQKAWWLRVYEDGLSVRMSVKSLYPWFQGEQGSCRMVCEACLLTNGPGEKWYVSDAARDHLRGISRKQEEDT